MENKNKIRTFWDRKTNKKEKIEPKKKKKKSNIYLILVVA